MSGAFGEIDPAARRLLILGGTREARLLARRVVDDAAEGGAWAPVLSLAGLTERTVAAPCPTRRGGFGGAEGLASYLAEQRIAALANAAHPFAAQISANAAWATRQARVPLLRIERAAWRPEPGDLWREVETLEAAAAAPPPGARVFLSIGPESAGPFTNRPDLWCALRRIEPTAAPFPLAQGRWVIGRPPFSAAQERRLFADLGIEWLITKNSGGDRAKLDAARELGLPVVMAARPAGPDGVETAETVEQALAWLSRQSKSAP